MIQMILDRLSARVSLLQAMLAALKARLPSGLRCWDTIALLAAVLVMNVHLIGIGSGRWALFLPSAVGAGQWWRLFTHPFVHVSWYHLLLDAGAFFILYNELEATRPARKARCLLMCAAGGLAAALLFSPLIDTYGLCGLSGTAHGLMAYSGLQMLEKAETRRAGVLSFSLVAVKSVYELINGTVFFAFLHMGLCGTPVAACHFGGVVGGSLAYALEITRRHHSKIHQWAVSSL